jgi:hypothetical protein
MLQMKPFLVTNGSTSEESAFNGKCDKDLFESVMMKVVVGSKVQHTLFFVKEAI